MNKQTRYAIGIVGILAIVPAIALAQWTSAPSNPPSSNAAAPINVSSNDQAKAGGLSIGTLMSVTQGLGVGTNPYDTNGSVNALKYCINGANCINSWPSGGGGGQWTDGSGGIIYYNGGNVGIGTNIPATALTVKNAGGSVNGSILAADSADSDYTFIDPNYGLTQNRSAAYINNSKVGGNIFVRTSNASGYDTTAMTIYPGGNVGIGTSPSYKLDVAGQVNAASASGAGGYISTGNYGGTGNAAYFPSGIFANGPTEWIYGNVYFNNGLYDNSGTDKWHILSSTGEVKGTTLCIAADCRAVWPSGGSSQWTTSGSSIYYNGGNVGIGTNAPGRILDLSIPAGGNSIRLTSSAVTTDFGINGSNNFGFLYTRTAVPLVFGTNNAERIRIDASGNVGIGNLTPAATLDVAGSGVISGGLTVGTGAPLNGLIVSGGNVGIGTGSPGAKLEVAGQVKITGGTPGAGKILTSDASGLATWQTPSGGGAVSSVNSGSNITVSPTTGATTVGLNSTVTISGNMTAAGFFYSSDRNLKTNIAQLADSLDKIQKLQGVSFDWKNDGSPSVGLIAQDVEKVYPELVKTDPQTGLKSVEYGNLVAPLIESVKAQQKEIDSLKAEIEALKAVK